MVVTHHDETVDAGFDRRLTDRDTAAISDNQCRVRKRLASSETEGAESNSSSGCGQSYRPSKQTNDVQRCLPGGRSRWRHSLAPVMRLVSQIAEIHELFINTDPPDNAGSAEPDLQGARLHEDMTGEHVKGNTAVDGHERSRLLGRYRAAALGPRGYSVPDDRASSRLCGPSVVAMRLRPAALAANSA